MDAAEFSRTVGLGLGRPILHLQRNDAGPFADIVLDACLHSKAYDRQTEGSRTSYTIELARATGRFDGYAGAVLSALGTEACDDDACLRFEFARQLAEEAYPGAREAMYDAFDAGRAGICGSVGWQFIVLDGINGLLFVAQRVGEQSNNAVSTRDPFDEHFLFETAVEEVGREAAEDALRTAAESSAEIAAFREAVRAADARLKQRVDPRALSYAEIRALIEDRTVKPGRLVSTVGGWGKTADDANLRDVVLQIVRETEPGRLFGYLSAFRFRDFLLPLDRLLELAGSPDDSVADSAIGLLARVESEEVRRLAFQLVESESSHRGEAIRLVAKNFRQDDHRTVEAWYEAEHDPDVLHRAGFGLHDFFKAHPDPEGEIRVLKCSYEKQPCGFCRSHDVTRLIELNSLPNALREECALDSYRETRKLVTNASR